MPTDEVALIINHMNQNHDDLSSQLADIRHALQGHAERISVLETRCRENRCRVGEPQSVWQKPIVIGGAGAGGFAGLSVIIDAIAGWLGKGQ